MFAATGCCGNSRIFWQRRRSQVESKGNLFQLLLGQEEVPGGCLQGLVTGLATLLRPPSKQPHLDFLPPRPSLLPLFALSRFLRPLNLIYPPPPLRPWLFFTHTDLPPPPLQVKNTLGSGGQENLRISFQLLRARPPPRPRRGSMRTLLLHHFLPDKSVRPLTNTPPPHHDST